MQTIVIDVIKWILKGAVLLKRFTIYRYSDREPSLIILCAKIRVGFGDSESTYGKLQMALKLDHGISRTSI